MPFVRRWAAMKIHFSFRYLMTIARGYAVIAGLLFGALPSVQAQIAPGPYEILPFEEGFIIEAFKDLQAGAGIADWSGVAAASWVSPNAYNEHTGTDFALQSGTPL